ncbi:MAG: zinc-ribbon domain-containing protein [Candidatus Bathyarchaeota archaeon]
MENKYLSRDRVVGKQVIDSNAIIVGNVKDMSFNLASKSIALTVATKTATEIVIDGESIIVVGDVILVNKTIELPLILKSEGVSTPPRLQVVNLPSSTTPIPVPTSIPAPTSANIGICSICGYRNDLNSKFCIKCGNKL